MDEATPIERPLFEITMRCECGGEYRILASKVNTDLRIRGHWCTGHIALPVSWCKIADPIWEDITAVYVHGRHWKPGDVLYHIPEDDR